MDVENIVDKFDWSDQFSTTYNNLFYKLPQSKMPLVVLKINVHHPSFHIKFPAISTIYHRFIHSQTELFRPL